MSRVRLALVGRVIGTGFAALAVAACGRDDVSPIEPSTSVTAPAGVAEPAGVRANRGSVSDVRLELLRPANTPTATPERNPFRFQARAEPVVFRPPAEIPAQLPIAPLGPPPLPPIPLRFVGLLEAPQSAGRVAILSDGRGNIVNGKEGDIIEGRYRLLRIGADSAELAYLDGRGRQVIRLSGQ